METQTRFDLNAAIENWRRELAAQPDLTPVVRRELETHLRDTIAELRRRGLNDEESFWLASRRLGRPERLNEEFAKADPAKVWRERVFWIVLVVLVIDLWNGDFIYLLLYKNKPVNLAVILFRWVPLLTGLTGVILITRGRFKLFNGMERAFLHSRLLTATGFVLWIFINARLLAAVMARDWIEFIVSPAVLLALLLLLVPKQTSLKPKHI